MDVIVALGLKFANGLGGSLISIALAAAAFVATRKWKPTAVAFICGQVLTLILYFNDDFSAPYQLESLLVFTVAGACGAFVVWGGYRISRLFAAKAELAHAQSEYASLYGGLPEWKDFETAAQIFPDLKPTFRELAPISQDLTTDFLREIVQTRSYESAWKLKEQMINRYLANSFGQDRSILDLAKRLLELGHLPAFREFQQAANVLGPAADLATLGKRILQKHSLDNCDVSGLPRSPFDNLKRNLARLYKSGDGYIAILRDGFSIGFDERGCKLFSPMADYSQSIRAFANSHQEVLDPLRRERFVSTVQKLLASKREKERESLVAG